MARNWWVFYISSYFPFVLYLNNLSLPPGFFPLAFKHIQVPLLLKTKTKLHNSLPYTPNVLTTLLTIIKTYYSLITWSSLWISAQSHFFIIPLERTPTLKFRLLFPNISLQFYLCMYLWIIFNFIRFCRILKF